MKFSIQLLRPIHKSSSDFIEFRIDNIPSQSINGCDPKLISQISQHIQMVLFASDFIVSNNPPNEIQSLSKLNLAPFFLSSNLWIVITIESIRAI